MKRPVLFILITLLSVLMLTSCGGGVTLRYNITGTSEEAVVRLMDGNGEILAEQTVKPPFEAEFKAGNSFQFQVYVTNVSGQGTAQCEVFADDRSLGDASGNVFAGCEGRYEKQGSETRIRFTSHENIIPDDYKAPAIKAPAGVNGMFLFAGDQKSAERRDFYIYDPAVGGEPIRLTDGLGRSSSCPRLSPDGTQLVFVYGGSVSDLFLLDLKSGGLTNLTNDAKQAIEGFCADWSPDGSQIIYGAAIDRIQQIFAIRTDGSGLTQLTTNTNSKVDYQNPVFSPDGGQIAFIGGTLTRNVYRMNADGSAFDLFWQPEQSVRDFYWSPDGTRIVYACFDAAGEGVCLMNSDGSEAARITDNSLERVYYTDWSPDGAKIAFIAKKDGETNLFVINPDGTELLQITHLQGIDPHWVSWVPSANVPNEPFSVAIGTK